MLQLVLTEAGAGWHLPNRGIGYLGLIKTCFCNEVEGDAFFNPNDDGGKAFGATEE